MTQELGRLSRAVAAEAGRRGIKLVAAESCTAGLVAHSLSSVPGASQWLCGSAVVYRDETKTAWLSIAAAQLADPAVGPVSLATAAEMCAGVLRLTPEADVAVSVTGHLGPQAPPTLDGLIYIGIQRRLELDRGVAAQVTQVQLPTQRPRDCAQHSLREYRQQLAVEAVLERLLGALAATSD